MHRPMKDICDFDDMMVEEKEERSHVNFVSCDEPVFAHVWSLSHYRIDLLKSLTPCCTLQTKICMCDEVRKDSVRFSSRVKCQPKVYDRTSSQS